MKMVLLIIGFWFAFSLGFGVVLGKCLAEISTSYPVVYDTDGLKNQSEYVSSMPSVKEKSRTKKHKKIKIYKSFNRKLESTS